MPLCDACCAGVPCRRVPPTSRHRSALLCTRAPLFREINCVRACRVVGEIRGLYRLAAALLRRLHRPASGTKAPTLLHRPHSPHLSVLGRRANGQPPVGRGRHHVLPRGVRGRQPVPVLHAGVQGLEDRMGAETHRNQGSHHLLDGIPAALQLRARAGAICCGVRHRRKARQVGPPPDCAG